MCTTVRVSFRILGTVILSLSQPPNGKFSIETLVEEVANAELMYWILARCTPTAG